MTKNDFQIGDFGIQIPDVISWIVLVLEKQLMDAVHSCKVSLDIHTAG